MPATRHTARITPGRKNVVPLATHHNPYIPPKSRIKKAERGPGVASRWRRLAAHLINVVLSHATTIPLFLMFSGYGMDTYVEFLGDIRVGWDVVGWLCFANLPWLAVNTVLIHKHSQSVGKMLMKIRVVGGDGYPVGTVRQIFPRLLLPEMIDAVLFVFFVDVFFLFDALFIFRYDRRCLHDMIADTMVVDA